MKHLALALTIAASLVASLAVADEMYIPVAGKTAGANGTSWRTDLRLFNPSPAESLDVVLQFLLEGEDGSHSDGVIVRVAPRQMLVMNDAAGSLLPGRASVVGAIRISSGPGRRFVAHSRTWTPGSRDGALHTYGQYVPALDPAAATADSVVLQVAATPEFRTNLGAMNPGEAEATVTATLYAWDGLHPLEAQPFVVPPRSMRQISTYDLFGGMYLADGYVVFRSTIPLFTWGSVVDNFSGDAFVVLGRAESDGSGGAE